MDKSVNRVSIRQIFGNFMQILKIDVNMSTFVMLSLHFTLNDGHVLNLSRNDL